MEKFCPKCHLLLMEYPQYIVCKYCHWCDYKLEVFHYPEGPYSYVPDEYF